MIDFLCVLQTHTLSTSQSHTNFVRYGCTDKAEITKRCVRSLVKSMNYADAIMPNINFRLQVLDDHSDEKSIEILKQILSTTSFESNLQHLNTYGIMPSILQCYEYGHNHGKDIVYFAQDDYLYTESAIHEMILMFFEASENLRNWCAIYPFDDPWSYTPENVAIPVQIIRGKSRHWRRAYQTASCFMTHHEVITKHWELFEAMGKHPINDVMEDETINKLFRERNYVLLTPIPSIALHFQYDIHKDPYINWNSWWDLHEDK